MLLLLLLLVLLLHFSALQRAENSSIRPISGICRLIEVFQCSSASRKFLNSIPDMDREKELRISVLFSEPKIPQCLVALAEACDDVISVLFSEPKIPQYQNGERRAR